MNGGLWLVGLTAGLALFGCAMPQQSQSNWAIDQQAIYCANNRVAGFAIGDPRSLTGAALIGPIAGAGAAALAEEQTCQLVRSLSVSDIAALKSAQSQAARDGRSAVSGPFLVTAQPIGADCVPITTLHQPSGWSLRSESLCRNRLGEYAPYSSSVTRRSLAERRRL